LGAWAKLRKPPFLVSFFCRVVKRSPGVTVWETSGFDVFEDGWMGDKHDLSGLEAYLVDLGIMQADDSLVKGN